MVHFVKRLQVTPDSPLTGQAASTGKER